MKTSCLFLLLAQATADQVSLIEARLAALDAKLAGTPGSLMKDDAAVHAKAARMILRHREEFYKPEYVKYTLETLERGLAKLAGPVKGARVCHAYRSRVDESLQPYCLTIPASYDGAAPVRLDVILHGRNATLTEASFLATHETAKPLPAGQSWIELEVFGRTNNAYRWAGETDVFEAVAAVKSRYKIDERRVVLRGFSMGGAGTWHIGLHHPGEWVAMEAGAGFAETKKYQNITSMPEYQERMLHIYDALDYAENGVNLPVVGYGGELDKQLAASQAVQSVLKNFSAARALFLVGPKTEHKWHPDSKKSSDEFINEAAKRGRPDPEKIRFVTYTTRYHRAFWLSVEGLERHYERALVEADGLSLKTSNVSRLRVDRAGAVTIDGQKAGTGPGEFAKAGGRWGRVGAKAGGLRKRPGLQGPIDDAFLDAFAVSGAPAAVAAEWDKYMRGELPVLRDGEWKTKHAVLFGDPSTNELIARINGKLPVRWQGGQIVAGTRKWDASTHTLAMIYPNPLNPERYVVLNSGHTFGEKEFKASNAQLYPRLPDWAVREKATGAVVAGGFFDERWGLDSSLAFGQ